MLSKSFRFLAVSRPGIFFTILTCLEINISGSGTRDYDDQPSSLEQPKKFCLRQVEVAQTFKVDPAT